MNDASPSQAQEYSSEDDVGKEKVGRKKNPETSVQRKVQNRLAQREFRQRKQQYVKDLEAKVALLERNPVQQLEQLRNFCRALHAENGKLRALVQGLSGLVGSGAGSCVESLGLSQAQFTTILEEESQSFEVLLQQMTERAGSGSGGVTTPGGGDSASPSAAAAGPSSSSSTKKRKRASAPPPDASPSFPPPPAPAPPPPPQQHPSAPAGSAHNFDVWASQVESPVPSLCGPRELDAADSLQTLLDIHQQRPQRPAGGTSLAPPLFAQPAGSAPALDPALKPDNNRGNTTEFACFPSKPGSMNASDMERFIRSVEYSTNKVTQAAQLIMYNLENYKNDPTYVLPPSLKPTLTQRTIPHDPMIDGVPFPKLRDKMILMSGRYDLQQALERMMAHMLIHGEDVLDHQSWEIEEGYLRRFWFLVDDDQLLAGTNRWRVERGQPPITAAELREGQDLERYRIAEG